MTIYEKHTYNSPALPFIFHTSCVRRRTSSYLAGNWHENIELLSFISGEGTVRIDGKDYSVGARDVVVVNANCLHEFKSETEMIYRVLIIDRAFFISNYINIDALHFSTRFRDEKISLAVERLTELYLSDEKNKWRELSIRSEVLNIITLLCSEHSELFDNGLLDNASLLLAVKRAIGHIHSKYQSELSLDGICSLVGLSKFYFSREFRRITGYSIANYISLTRLEKAKLLLTESDSSVSEIATACGFYDQSYFTRIFKKKIGITPTEYRRSYSKPCEGGKLCEKNKTPHSA